MTEHFEMLIPGADASADLLNVTAPYDLQLIATVDTADSAAVEKALQTAHQLYTDRAGWLSATKRIEVLENTARIMTERAEELALEAAREGGKPLIDSRVEVTRAIDGIKICIETIRTQGGEEIPMGINAASANRMAFTRLEPIGVVVVVSAFNHPLNLAIHQVAPAIATGCPVIVKPTKETPLSCFRFVKILHEAGLPEAWCQALVIKDRTFSNQLVTDNRVAFLSFIGSANIGWMLRSTLAPGTRCALEHGGAAPVIVAEDADFDAATPLLAKSGFYHAGQVCVSAQRLFVHKSIAKKVALQIAKLAENMTVGDPTLEETDIGPLIRPAENQRIAEWVNEAIDEGAELLCGGKPISDTCYPATVLFNPSATSKVSQMEIFGPVICVYPFSDMDEAIQQANSLPFAFQSAIFTRDIDTALRASRHLDASAVMINDLTTFRVDWMPFAGLRQSGLGVGGIPHTIHDMQHKKMLVFKSQELL